MLRPSFSLSRPGLLIEDDDLEATAVLLRVIMPVSVTLELPVAVLYLLGDLSEALLRHDILDKIVELRRHASPIFPQPLLNILSAELLAPPREATQSCEHHKDCFMEFTVNFGLRGMSILARVSSLAAMSG